MVKKDVVVVRAYDLGGFGDIAGALRVTDYLARQGKNVGILPMSGSAKEKVGILAPNYPATNRFSQEEARVVVDVAGHYQDGRVFDNLPIPHVFIEDMDNPSNRAEKVPLYVKTGLVRKGVSEQIKECGVLTNPLFYRPFGEEDIPDKKDLNPLELILAQLSRRITNGARKLQTNLVRTVLEDVSEICFAHFRPNIGTALLATNYVQTVKKAAEASSNKQYLVGLFLPKDDEERVMMEIMRNEELNYVSHQNIRIKDPHFLTLVFLGSTPQAETSKMFLSATIPSLVTGDLSLSDAIYFLLARDGQGFFYDCPAWKTPTEREMREEILDAKTSILFQCNKRDAVTVFLDEKKREEYKNRMRESFIAEIHARFGKERVWGKKIPSGTPFLFQDAAGLVVDKLLNDKGFYDQIEKKRTRIGKPYETPEKEVKDECCFENTNATNSAKKEYKQDYTMNHSLLSGLSDGYTVQKKYPTQYFDWGETIQYLYGSPLKDVPKNLKTSFPPPQMD